jgi:hypothetical protein
MPTAVLDDIPDQITAGNAFAWKKCLSDYPASAGWVLSYALVKSSGLDTRPHCFGVLDAIEAKMEHCVTEEYRNVT